MANNRDNFSEKTKLTLAHRVGVKCSNPDCRKPTSGPNEDPNKIINIGVAAHICAASEGGPRYDPTMSKKERKSIENGIWLCQSCSKLIDSDESTYTKEKLLTWKGISETYSKFELENNNSNIQDVSTYTPHKKSNFSDRWFKSDEERFHIFWGYQTLDDFCKITDGSLVLLVGYSDSDNSMLFHNIVRNNIKHQRKIVYFNLKETSASVVNKMLSAESHVEYEHIRTASLTTEEWSRIAFAIKALDNKSLILEPYKSTQNTSQYVLDCVKYSNSDLIVIDDLSGLDLDDKSLTSYMYRLKSIASESNTTVFVILNITNAPKPSMKRINISDPQISELNKFFDVIQFLHIDEESIFFETPESDEIELVVAKNFSPNNNGTVILHKSIPYFLVCDIEQSDKNKKVSKKDKYPGLFSGVQTLADLLKDF